MATAAPAAFSTSVSPLPDSQCISRQLTHYRPFPSRIHTASYYPLPAPYSHTHHLQLVGHAEGLTLIFEPLPQAPARRDDGRKLRFVGVRGGMTPLPARFGSPVKRSQHPVLQAQRSGQSTPTGEAGAPQERSTRFIPLGSPVLHIAALPPQAVAARQGNSALKPLSSRLLKRNVLIAVACLDASVHFLRIPLPRNLSSSDEQHDEIEMETTIGEESTILVSNPNDLQKFTFAGISSHRTAPSTLSLSLFSTPPTTHSPPSETLLVASTSRSPRALLLIFRIAISLSPSGEIVLAPNHDRYDTLSLTSPCVRLAFHPSAPTRLLLADEKGSLRLGDVSTREWILVGQARRVLDFCWCRSGEGVGVLWKGGEVGMYGLDGSYASLGGVPGTGSGSSERGVILEGTWSGREVLFIATSTHIAHLPVDGSTPPGPIPLHLPSPPLQSLSFIASPPTLLTSTSHHLHRISLTQNTPPHSHRSSPSLASQPSTLDLNFNLSHEREDDSPIPTAKRRKMPMTPHVKVLRGAKDVEEARGGRRDFGQGRRETGGRRGLLFG